MAADHVRMVPGADGKPCARCLHCGKDEPLPALPSDLASFALGLEDIVGKHRYCPKPPPERKRLPWDDRGWHPDDEGHG